ncbi:hypothetical protein [Roseibium marinum]|uniref:Inclusion body protein n=1 Tax=Roseibium marinum TaxID=281252 RepID=A0A2S3UVR1_9HYPH|nr:hypothetical protein [Roseibium marinum]POF31776.1 hypothetical protein CLV41_104346 [Roseibium marinum]
MTTPEIVAEVSLVPSTKIQPQTSITIAVDTAYVAGQQSGNIVQGIYMMDNRVANGTTGEGTLELSTVCNIGDLVGFNAVPINALGSSEDEVEITAINVSYGSVFSAAGMPRPQPALPGEPAGAYWIGQAFNKGTQTYQIQIKVTVGKLQPISYFVSWNPFITCK